MRKLLLIILSLLSANVFAATTNAASCIPVQVKSQGNNIILPGPAEARSAQLYFFKNNSKQSVWLDHPNVKASMSAGWSSYLRAGNWAALMLNRKNFTISCSVITPGKVEELNCAKTISVCVAKNSAELKNQKNTYWVAEDKSWDELVKAMTKRGVSF